MSWDLPRRAGWGALAAAGVAFVLKDLHLYQIVSFTGSRVGLVLAIVAAGALLGLFKLRALAWGALGMTALIWLAVAMTPLARALAHGVLRRDALAPADAVYVLASSIDRNGTMSEVAHARLTHGLELVKQGLAPRLLLSELRPPRAHFADGARALMGHLGIEAEVIAVGPVDDTHDEAVLVAELCRERGWRRLILVTSPLHSRRAAATFERQGLEITSAPSEEGRYDLTLDEADDRVRAFGDIMHERLGLWVYGRRGWL